MSTPGKTNIVFILTDDQGIWAAGCYGNPEIRTPNIDRVAATGVRFENFFITIPVCSASRASFLTGRIPSQHGVHDFITGGADFGPDAKAFLNDEICYTDVLSEHGWTCGLSGKWHLGNSILAQHGFSHWFAHPRGAGKYNDQEMIRDGVAAVAPGYVTNAITEDALTFIDAHAADDSPFYLSVHYTAPHSPWTGHPQDIVDSYDDCPFESCPQEPKHPGDDSINLVYSSSYASEERRRSSRKYPSSSARGCRHDPAFHPYRLDAAAFLVGEADHGAGALCQHPGLRA